MIDKQAPDLSYGFKDLNRLYDAAEYFKPVTIATYAKSKGVSVQSVYKRIKNETIMYIEIDGVKFVIE